MEEQTIPKTQKKQNMVGGGDDGIPDDDDFKIEFKSDKKQEKKEEIPQPQKKEIIIPQPNQEKKIQKPQDNPQPKKKDNQKKLTKKEKLSLIKTDLVDLNYENFMEETSLNFQKFKKGVDKIHARKKIKTEDVPYTYSDLFLKTRTGYNCCGYTTQYSQLNQYGVGMTLYFKTLKNLAHIFCLFTILSIPVIYFALSIAHENNLINQDLQSYIYATSVGVFGDSSLQCSMSQVVEEQFDLEQELILNCLTGQFEMDKTLYTFFLLNPSTQICSEVDVDGYEIGDLKCNENQTYNQKLKEYIQSQCQGQQVCSLVGEDIKNYFNDCQGSTSFFIEQNLQFLVRSRCLGQVLPFFNGFGQKIELTSTDLSFIAAITDVVIIVIYLITVIGMKFSDQKTQNASIKKTIQASKFSIMLSNLPTMQEEDLKISLKLDLQRYINKQVKEKHPKHGQECEIIDVRIAETSHEILLRRMLGQQQEIKKLRMLKFLHKYDPLLKGKDPKAVSINMLTDIAKTQKGSKVNSALKEITEIKELRLKCDELQEKIDNHEKKAYTIKYAFLTFDTMQHRQYALDALLGSPFKRFLQCGFPDACCKCCFDPDVFFKKKHLVAVEAPVPDNIQWQNMYISSQMKIFRKFVSIILTLVLLIGSFIIIVYVRSEKDKVLEKYPKVNCGNQMFDSISQNDIMLESKSDSQIGYIECFCKPKIDDILEYTSSKQGYFKGKQDVYDICNDWLQDYSFVVLLPFAAVFCILGVNFIIQIVFRKLSSFEKYNYLTEELAARIQKIFMAMFINTGLILLITNVDYNYQDEGGALSFLFGGKYADISPSWFQNVGTVIILTIGINTFSTPFVLLGFHTMRLCKRRCDRNCRSEKTLKDIKTKKSTNQEWIDLYTGPDFMIDLRYSQILNILFIGMMYSSGLPIMYLLVFLHLGILYWFDKIWVFTICKLPKNYDNQMQELVRFYLYLIPLVHCIFAVYIYGNSQIFFEIDNYESLDIQKDSSKILTKFFERITREQNYALLAIILIIILVFAIRCFCWQPFIKLTKKCCNKAYKKGINKNPARKKNFYECLDKEMLQDEIDLIDYYKLNTENEQFKTMLDKRRIQLNTIKNQPPKDDKNEQQTKLVGLFSYDIRHNPEYKKLYGWQEQGQMLQENQSRLHTEQ